MDLEKVLECFNQYITFVAERAPSYKEYVQKLELKMQACQSRTRNPQHNEQSVSHLILDAHLARKCMKIPVDISADSHAFRFGIFK